MSCEALSDTLLKDTLLKDIGHLYDGADDYNVKIQIGEDSEMQIFKAHSVILRARSTYFRSAFSSNWARKEGNFFIFKKPNITAIVFQIILKYIYTGTISLDAVNVKNHLLGILIAADELNLCELVEYLQQHIISLNNNWILRNGAKLFNVIYQHKGVFPKLEEYCNDIMSQEPELFIESNEFWGLDDDALLSIIQLDSLKMEEVSVWENLIKWGIAKNPSLNSDMTTWSFNDYEILKESLSKFIQHVRFFNMSPEEYYYKVRPLSKLISKELEEDLYLYYIVPDSKLATNILPPRRYQNNSKFDSSFLLTKHFNLISYWIDNGKEVLPDFLKSGQYEYKLLLRGSRDGFESKIFNSKCYHKGATVIFIRLKNSNKIIGGYNPEKWSGSGNFLTSRSSFIFSFGRILNSSTTILSRIKNTISAISDSNTKCHGFGCGDLCIFLNTCQLSDYSVKIHDSETFEIDDYEVFQVVKKFV